MIRTITGHVIETYDQAVLVLVNGFGLYVHVPTHHAITLSPESPITLHTHLVVKDSGPELYGFSDESTRAFFELLLTVSGVGPRSALGITNLAPVETLSDAIYAKDIQYLTKVAGVGKKAAEKIVLELRDKVTQSDQPAAHTDDAELLDALISLGYKEREAKEAIKQIPNTLTHKDDRLKAALRKTS